mmetsp:Transcript_20715/g.20824  ORF Transcript_20715/g.20824 Transcript_20715/m.20824 type:complete len:99 (+) Transcript_20715:146-442(+)
MAVVWLSGVAAGGVVRAAGVVCAGVVPRRAAVMVAVMTWVSLASWSAECVFIEVRMVLSTDVRTESICVRRSVAVVLMDVCSRSTSCRDWALSLVMVC